MQVASTNIYFTHFIYSTFNYEATLGSINALISTCLPLGLGVLKKEKNKRQKNCSQHKVWILVHVYERITTELLHFLHYLYIVLSFMNSGL